MKLSITVIPTEKAKFCEFTWKAAVEIKNDIVISNISESSNFT